MKAEQESFVERLKLNLRPLRELHEEVGRFAVQKTAQNPETQVELGFADLCDAWDGLLVETRLDPIAQDIFVMGEVQEMSIREAIVQLRVMDAVILIQQDARLSQIEFPHR
ncbi:MAG TPA: hypothetical protein VLG25_00065 [Patescibacteria group bacterium]|nr:hypothetical protein [Patescibacteria group bacterium]